MFGEVLKAIGSGGPVSLPCTMYEPLSVLQRTVEMFEFRSCLDKALQYKDPVNRIAFVAAFATSSLAYTVGRFSMLTSRFTNAQKPISILSLARPLNLLTQEWSH